MTAAAGVSLTGKFGTIKRSDGTLQATYLGHPLYTYAGDTSAGVVGGNGKNLSGGLWWAITPSGAKPTAGRAAPQPSTSTSSGGYCYSPPPRHLVTAPPRPAPASPSPPTRPHSGLS